MKRWDRFSAFTVMTFILFVSLLLFGACSKSKSPTGPGVDEKVEQTDNGIIQTIAPAKDSEVVLKDELSISIPGGAVSSKDFPEGLAVTVERVTADSPEDVGAIAVEVQPLSPVYHIDAGKTTFSKSVSLRVPVSNIDIPDGLTTNDLQIVTWSDSNIDQEFLATTLSGDGKYLEADVSHFSYFAVKLKKESDIYGKLDMSLHISRDGDNLVFDNLYSNLETNLFKALKEYKQAKKSIPRSIWISYQVEVFKDGLNDALAAIQMYRISWYSKEWDYAEQNPFILRAGELYGKSGYTINKLKENNSNESDIVGGAERIIIYDSNEKPISDREKIYSFPTQDSFGGFLKDVLWSDASKRFCPVSVISDPNAKFFVKVTRVYQDGQGFGGNTQTTEKFTPYDIPPVVTLSEPANFAKVKTFTPEFAWDGSSAANVPVNYEIRLSAKNNDPVKNPEITKQVGSVERFFNSGGVITLQQLPYYWCVRAYTVKDGKQVTEAFSEVKSFEVVGPDTYTVSGRVLLNGAGLSGVSVNLKGTDTDKTIVTGSDGTYTFAGVSGGSYTITSTLAGYTISTSNPFSVYANTTVPDFTATKIPIIIAISGVITENGTGLSGVTVTLSGVATKTFTTQSDGKYSFTGLTDGTYTVTPSKTGYHFSPPSNTFTNAVTDKTQNFTGYTAVVELLRIEKDPSVTGQYWFYATTFSIPEIQEVQFFIDSSNASNMIDLGGGLWRIPIKTTSVSEGTHTARVKAIDKQLNIIGEHTMQFIRTGDTITEGGPQTIQGITFVSIPGGTFQMGDVENAGYGDEKPVHSVTVSGFEVGMYEITNAQYAQYLNAAKATGDITPSSTSVKGAKGAFNEQEYIYLAGTYSSYTDARCWITYNNDTFSVVSGHENWPVMWVSWYGSKAFALYCGLDLPTEAEWEYACRGRRQYKYGTDDGTISSTKANYNYNIGHPIAVGSYPANPYGLYDMSGNVWEWCHDWFGGYPRGSVENPSGEQTGSSRILRGGSWTYDDVGCRAANRYELNPGYGYLSLSVGFRVVRRASPQNY